jgi:hypothetical protein
LVELWLLSGTNNPAMWNALATRITGWTRHIDLINTWKHTMLALTRRLFALLFGPSEGTEHIMLKMSLFYNFFNFLLTNNRFL